MEDPSLYRSTVGSLQYLSLTRPDLSFVVNRVCQFMHRPLKPHWQAVKRILRYLQYTLSHGLLLHRSSSNVLAYSDVDWVGCPDDHPSTGAYCVFIGSNLVSWSSRKQPTVSRSSTEAKYKAVANTIAELLWIQVLLQELGVRTSSPPTLWCDNIGATTCLSIRCSMLVPSMWKLTFTLSEIALPISPLVVRFVPSSNQLADVLTKPLVSAKF